jgi:hypothetical protein
MKNDVKMATVNTLESKNNKNETKMHFAYLRQTDGSA